MVLNWNLARCKFVLGDFTIDGFGPDDSISIEPNSDRVEWEVGAEGNVAVSWSNDKTHVATITLRRGTAAFRLLGELLQSQIVESSTGLVSDTAFEANDPVTGTKVSEQRAYVIAHPTLDFTRSMPTAEYRLLLTEPRFDYGANIETAAA